MVKITPFAKPLGVTAALLGIVQGLAWIILAFFAILIYLGAWIPEFEIPVTHGKLLKRAMVDYLTVLETGKEFNVIITSSGLFAWSVIYLITSLIWVGISSVLLWALRHEKYDFLRKILIRWAGWTGLICLCDLILTILLGLDYNKFLTIVNEIIAASWVKNPSLAYIVLACGIFMTLAAKGFVLWIVNLTFAILLGYLSSNLMKKEQQNTFNNNNTANLFSNSPQGNSNPAFNWYHDKPNFPRSDSFVSSSLQGYEPAAPQNYPKPLPKPAINDRLIKIEKPGGKSPPYNVAPPKPPQNYIYPANPRVPSPDYSPPNSPYQTPLKSALKNHDPQNPFTFASNPRY